MRPKENHMKKKLLTGAFAALACSAWAQPTIQSGQFDWLLAPSFSYKYQSGQTAVAPGPSGANVTWNFSSLSAGSTLNYTTTACPGDPDCGTFPGANQVVNVGTLSKTYYIKTANKLEQVGDKGSASMVFSNPLTFLQFPVTYNQTYSDTYAASGASGDRSGTVSSTIDGYGTLQTPTGIYTNVLRQKIVENMTITTGGQTATMLVTQYYWLKADMHHYVMSLIVTEMTGTPVPATYVVTYTTAQPGGVGISERDMLTAETTLYPNPITDALTIRTRTLPMGNIELFNVLGQRVLHHDVQAAERFSVSLTNLDLPAGNYFVRIQAGGTHTTRTVSLR